MYFSNYHALIAINYVLLFGFVILLLTFLVGLNIYIIKEYIAKKRILYLISIIITTIILLGAIYKSKNIIYDLPNLIENNYIIASGTAMGNNNGGEEPENRGFLFQTDEGELINITVTYYPINKGDKFKVIYLPHTKLGAIIEKLE